MYKEPTLEKIRLSKEYKFMYENFIICTQSELYLLLEETQGIVDTLKFDFSVYKYGYPNDEGIGAHPMANFGLGWYEFYRVSNSMWINEMKEQRPTPTTYDRFEDLEHYIITFKDVTLDVVSKKYEEIKLSKEQINNLVASELDNLTAD